MRRLSLLALLLAGLSAPAAAQRTIGVQPAPGVTSQGSFYADSWAVIIGINDYQHERVPKLRYAVNDARSVEAALLQQGFRRDRITVLTDKQATKARIEAALGDRLRQHAGRDDRVLVFFAGHGMTLKLRSGEDEGYLIPVDGDPSLLYSTGISMSSLRQISDLLPAKHILYVVDACYSGYAVFNRAIADELLDEMVKKSAIQILTAGRQGDQAQEKGGHGVFTDVLLRGLRGEAFAGRSWLALDQLGAWVRERVYAESNKRQVPQFGNLSGDGQFVFLRPSAQLAAVPPSAPPRTPSTTTEIVREHGSLAIRSRVAGVELWLGDQRIGETQAGAFLVVNNVGAGTHRLRAKKPGHKDWEREVLVAENHRAEVTVELEPERPSAGVEPKGIVGTWRGDMQQPGVAPFPVTITLWGCDSDSTCGRIEHSTLQCVGSLRSLGVRDGMHLFEQVIQSGRGKCLDGVNNLIPQGDRTLIRVWLDPRTNREGARGTLVRVDSPKISDLAGRLAGFYDVYRLNETDKGIVTRMEIIPSAGDEIVVHWVAQDWEAESTGRAATTTGSSRMGKPGEQRSRSSPTERCGGTCWVPGSTGYTWRAAPPPKREDDANSS
jgi:hypothetical protein